MISRNADFETYFLIEDQKVRESFQQSFDNTSNLQEQLDTLISLIYNATDLAALQSSLQSTFDAT
jgi:hypothetical protein